MGRRPAGVTAEYPVIRLSDLRAAGRREDKLTTFCWCEMNMLLVPKRDVAEGRTGSCGRPRCKAPV